jgi:hypothetical protein
MFAFMYAFMYIATLVSTTAFGIGLPDPLLIALMVASVLAGDHGSNRQSEEAPPDEGKNHQPHDEPEDALSFFHLIYVITLGG